MSKLFSPDSPYKKQARFVAILWTLLILAGCFTPGEDVPKVDVPFFDKWAHMGLFAGFSFLWLCANPLRTWLRLLGLFFAAIALGSVIEIMQGLLTFLHRSMELADALADTLGALIGIGIFCLAAYISGRPRVQGL